MSTDLTPNIATNAQGPQEVSGDAGSVTSQSIADQIMADRYLKSAASVDANSYRGLRLNRIIPSGTVKRCVDWFSNWV